MIDQAPRPTQPLVIIGPTASGKSELALAVAASVGGCEIVSADAKAVYKGMDIGTAKPTLDERAQVPHHLIDTVEVEEEYTMARFQVEVHEALDEISARKNVPIVVGGTGLYVRAVVDNFTVPDQYPDVRAELETEPETGRLWQRLHELDPVAAAKMHDTNRRRIVRALEVVVGSGRPFSSYGPGVDAYPETSFCQVGLEVDRGVMDSRIDRRYDQQLEQGFLDEVRLLAPRAMSRTARQALGYTELLDHLEGKHSLDDAVALAKKRTRKFARRQQRWFRRDPRITWLASQDPALIAKVVDQWRLEVEPQ